MSFSLRIIAVCLFTFSALLSHGQFLNTTWCFGHRSKIVFGQGSTTLDTCAAISRGSCASISDSGGNLLFYVAGDTVALYASTLKGGKVYTKLNSIMQNGDSLVTRAWYNEEVIVPNPSDSDLFYVFQAGVTSILGLYYSSIDLSLNAGIGAVTQKNIQLNNLRIIDCLAAVKHGNGRDWWLIYRPWYPNLLAHNEYHTLLITPSGISTQPIQHVGTTMRTNLANISFNKQGNRFAFSGYSGTIELYDFDRCSGVISNPVTIFSEGTPNGFNKYFGSAISPNGNVLYVSYSDGVSYLLQFDLTAPNIAATEDTIWSQTYPINAAGYMRLAPNDKIYLSCAYVPLTAPMYPYADSLYNMYNMNLSVINQPDSLGAACDFQPYSFYLGGTRTYWGLPNNPDYDLGALVGSGCDTLTSLPPAASGLLPQSLQVTWLSSWQKAFVNASNLKGQKWRLEVYDLFGNLVYYDNGSLSPPYFSRGIELPGIAGGMYIVRLQTEKELLTGKFNISK